MTTFVCYDIKCNRSEHHVKFQPDNIEETIGLHLNAYLLMAK